MIYFRRLSKNSTIAAPFRNATARRYFSTENPNSRPNTIPSSANYDDLINSAGRKRDFAAVRRLLSERLIRGCLNTSNTFKFISTDISALDELLENLATIDDRYARKHAHDALVGQLANLRRADEALRVAVSMAEKNYGATPTTFHPVLNELAKRKEMAAAWRAVEAMRACKVRPDRAAFNYILTAYCFTGDVSSAAETVAKMEAEGMKADSVTYDALVLGACRARRVEGALVVMRRMADDGVPPLFSTHAHIIKEMVRCAYYAPAVEYVRVFAGRDRKLDVESFGYLARELRKKKRVAEAKSVVEEMVERSLPVGDGLTEFLQDSM